MIFWGYKRERRALLTMDLETPGGGGLKAGCRRVCPLMKGIKHIYLTIIQTRSTDSRPR